MSRLKIAFPYLIFFGMALAIVWSNVNTGPTQINLAAGEKMIDPVCRMEVNANWDITYDFDGQTYYFCTERCRKLFAEDPQSYLVERCMVCNKPLVPENSLASTYMDRTYYLCSEEHRQQFKADPARYFMHRMWCIPDWLYFVSIGLLLMVSFGIFEGAKRIQKKSIPGNDVPNNSDTQLLKTERFDILRIGLVKNMLLSRPFRFMIQSFMAIIFLVIIAAGLFGHQNPALNIAPMLTWTIWWCGLVVLIMFAGKAWCYMCPWDAIATWMERLRFWKKTENGMGLGLPWPKMFRNITLATVFFVGLTWIELGFGVTMIPRATAYLGLSMLVMTIVAAFLFERKSFCRYGCLVGRVSGLYALFAGCEIRSKDKSVCGRCRSRQCVKGSETAYACPTFENPATMSTNTYCIQCAECLQACPHDNMAVNLRPWGADLVAHEKPRRDEAYLALLMLSISAFHGLTMTPIWQQLLEGIETVLPVGRILTFSFSMFVLMAAPILIYAILVWVSYIITNKGDRVSRPIASSSKSSYGDYFIRYAYCLLPIALFYHLAHNLEHLLMEGPKVFARFSDPFGWNWNLFHTADWSIPPLVSLDVLWVLQVILVGIGHVYSLWAAEKISRRFFGDQATATRGQIPMLIGMIAFSVLSLWLLKQPMEMRTSAM